MVINLNDSFSNLPAWETPHLSRSIFYNRIEWLEIKMIFSITAGPWHYLTGK